MKHYTIEQLQEIIGRSKAMIYNYIKEDENSKQFFAAHRSRANKGKGAYLYDEEALSYLQKKLVLNGVVLGQVEEEKQENPQQEPPLSDEAQQKIDALEAECAELKARLEKAEENNAELMRQNGQLLLILGEEKKEKQALLPAPHKGLIARIKDVFK